MTALSLRYLGVAGWHLSTPDSSLVIDPYFTRLSQWRVMTGLAIPDPGLIRQHLPSADWILVTHPHYDHLMDVPEAASITGAGVYASPQGVELLAILGVPQEQLFTIQPGDRLNCGDFEIEAYTSLHRQILGSVPYQEPLKPNLKPPLRAGDYRIRQQFSFLITAGETRVLIASGIDREPVVEADVLLVGADASQEQLRTILGGVRPRMVFPNHWDDMFRPLSKPTRPMIKPPKYILFIPRRIDLQAFAHTVQAIQPGTSVVLPDLFKPYDLYP